MKIERNTDAPQTVTPQTQAIRRKKPSPSTKIAPREVTGDAVEISEAARAHQVATEALKHAPAIRTGKVERLKAAIKTGTYKVSPQALAKKILDEDS